MPPSPPTFSRVSSQAAQSAIGWRFTSIAAALVFLRFYIFYAIAAATLAGMLMRHRRGMVLGLATQIVLLAGLIALFLYTPVGQEILMNSRFLDLQLLSVSRVDLARAESGFASAADVSTVGGILTVLPVGVANILFAPFPWTIANLRQALALPDVLMWYALVPALIRGIFYAHRRLRETMPILVFTTALTSPTAPSSETRDGVPAANSR
jgi:hypothetical protein